MPYPSPPRSPSGPRRRTLLASVAGAALLVGCSSGSEDSDGGTGGSPSLAERARARAARDSEGLVERYDAVLAAHPALAVLVGPLRAEAVRHAEAFGAGTSGPSGPSATTSEAPKGGSAAQSPSPSSSPPAAVPANERDALAELAAAERALADRRAKALVDLPGELARLLASVAAAGAAHAYLLTEGAK
ncbi:hypothetical protein [Streptomyces viridochromogenes]|uniref:hypothetical protein n=1 Tax=Streptomyces viridochromogenes TaxID=1938 RepID=UPI00069D9396|nr:hypothetical protein [Streptomyces viridochromogenes]KOG16750.1 lipoprotein [Streptomyces viridochromogenes]KOG17934.1 lipoprotein [Streptomyces viridochromogenes]